MVRLRPRRSERRGRNQVEATQMRASKKTYGKRVVMSAPIASEVMKRVVAVSRPRRGVAGVGWELVGSACFVMGAGESARATSDGGGG